MQNTIKLLGRENAVILRRCWGIEPGQITPPLSLAQTIPSARVQGECCVCLRPVLLFAPRDDGFLRVNGEAALVHWECAEAVRIAKAEPVQTAPEQAAKSPEQADRERRYRADLWTFHVRTLYTILRMYEESDPATITADMRWQIEIVRAVHDERASNPDLFEGRP